MNCVQLVGRLARDPETRQAADGSAVCRFVVAVDRPTRREGGDAADFIDCVSFGRTADFVSGYFAKGRRIGLTGRIRTGSYEGRDGRRVYTTDVVADRAEFVDPKPSATDDAGFMTIPDGAGDELPFSSATDDAGGGDAGFMAIPDGAGDELPY